MHNCHAKPPHCCPIVRFTGLSAYFRPRNRLPIRSPGARRACFDRAAAPVRARKFPSEALPKFESYPADCVPTFRTRGVRAASVKLQGIYVREQDGFCKSRAARSRRTLTSATLRGRRRESWPRLTTRPRPAPRPVFLRLLFPCSVPKAPDNDLFRSLEIPCSAPDPACKQRVVKGTAWRLGVRAPKR